MKENISLQGKRPHLFRFHFIIHVVFFYLMFITTMVEGYRPFFRDEQHLAGTGDLGFSLGIRVIRRRAYSGPSHRGRGHWKVFHKKIKVYTYMFSAFKRNFPFIRSVEPSCDSFITFYGPLSYGTLYLFFIFKVMIRIGIDKSSVCWLNMYVLF